MNANVDCNANCSCDSDANVLAQLLLLRVTSPPPRLGKQLRNRN